MSFLRPVILTITFLLVWSLPAQAMLGNSVEENDRLFESIGSEPKYHYGGDKNVFIYRQDNKVITVVYRNDVSILENITYINAVNQEVADDDITNFIIPNPQEKPSFKSNMMFVKGEAIEYIFKNGIRTKILLNENGKATDVMSSMNSFEEEVIQEVIEEVDESEEEVDEE